MYHFLVTHIQLSFLYCCCILVIYAAQYMYKENVILTVNCCMKVVPLRETYIELFLLTTNVRFYVTSAAIRAGKRHIVPFCIALYFVT